MRKFLIVFGILLLFLAACDEENADKVADDEMEQENEVIDEKDIDTDEVDVDDESENGEDDEVVNGETQVNNENDNKLESTVERGNVKEIAEDIIWAQVNKDYSYLKSVVADGVTVNENNNTLSFNTKEATHTFDFLSGVKEKDLEFRFVDGEDSEQAIVGYAAIDYENEYSYVVEMIFNLVDGNWKLTSMDINK